MGSVVHFMESIDRESSCMSAYICSVQGCTDVMGSKWPSRILLEAYYSRGNVMWDDKGSSLIIYFSTQVMLKVVRYSAPNIALPFG